MLNYIKKESDNKLYISIENSFFIMDTTIQKYINKNLIKTFSDFFSIEKNVKRVFNYKAKSPIYIDKNNLLMCIRSYRLSESLYINYNSIFNYTYTGSFVIIEFHSKHCLKIKEKYAFITQIKRCREINDFLNK